MTAKSKGPNCAGLRTGVAAAVIAMWASVTLLLSSLMAGQAVAQPYPARPIRIIVPFARGGRAGSRRGDWFWGGDGARPPGLWHGVQLALAAAWMLLSSLMAGQAVAQPYPAMGELGYKGMEADTFQGVFAPAGIPKPVLARLHAEIMKALAAPDVRERLAAIAMDPVANTPEAFAAQVHADIARWGKVIRDGNIKVD